MIEVRIRHENDADPVHLCDWPSTDLDSLIPTLTAWGVNLPGAEYYPDPVLSGIIVYEPPGAYFEVLIHDSSDA